MDEEGKPAVAPAGTTDMERLQADFIKSRAPVLSDGVAPQWPRAPQWRPGTSFNPGGAPKGKRISTWIIELAQIDPRYWPDVNNPDANIPQGARIAIARLRRAATEEGTKDAEIILDRSEGGVDRTLHLTHKQEPSMSMADAVEAMRASGLLRAGEVLALPVDPAAPAAAPAVDTAAAAPRRDTF